jgi:2-C-methyl-D-erythritol 4-phosphate cytidylyltransferase
MPSGRPDFAAVIVAGGIGTRFGGKVRKQYLALRGRPLYAWSLQAFARSPSIGVIVLVVPPDNLMLMRRQLSRFPSKVPVHVVAGGATRADSVRHGLAAVPPGFAWIAVHDAVRPLVSPNLIESVARAARSHRAAIAATPSKDTVKLAGRGDTIQRTLPRELVWLAQTPQAFERRLLERAHRAGRRRPVTDDAMLVEKLGIRVKLVASPPENIKVTVPADLVIAQRLLKGQV